MISAHLSDLHLGFRAYPATEGGRNVRELDVEKAFNAAIDQIIDHRPDVCTIAGDIVHHPGVGNHAIHVFLRGVRRLLEAGIRVIILQGNHDAGKTAAVLTPIMLADVLGKNLYVVTTNRRIMLTLTDPDLGRTERIAVSCFPFTALQDEEVHQLEPDPDADLNVLVMHAAVAGDQDGNLPWFYSGDRAIDVTREGEKWDIVHLGDFHEYRLFNCPGRVFYSGSIERTSSNIWDENQPKGWVSVDTSKPGHEGVEFHEIPTRTMEDMSYEHVSLDDPCAEGLNTALREQLVTDPDPWLDGAIVRLKVDDFPRSERDQIDRQLVREIQKRALHFQLDLRFKKDEAAEGGSVIRKGVSLAQAVAEFFKDDPAEVRELVARHIALQTEVEVEEQVA